MKSRKIVLGGLSILILITGFMCIGCASTSAPINQEKRNSIYAAANQAAAGKKLELADQYFENNNLAEALPVYIQVSEMSGISTKLKAWATFRSGRIYQTNGDIETAVELYIRAAELGSLTALLNLGGIYDKQGDKKKAHEMWLKAAEQGYPSAQYNIGVHYFYGVENVIGKDITKAIEWFKAAKENGYEDAEEALRQAELELKAFNAYDYSIPLMESFRTDVKLEEMLKAYIEKMRDESRLVKTDAPSWGHEYANYLVPIVEEEKPMIDRVRKYVERDGERRVAVFAGMSAWNIGFTEDGSHIIMSDNGM